MNNNKVLKCAFAIVMAGAFALAADAADGAKWIWYPGDYGIWWGNNLQSHRLQWGARYAPFWPLYEPHNRVLFTKGDISLEEDEELEVASDGYTTFCYSDDRGFHEEGVVLGKVHLPKSTRYIEVKIQNSVRPPALYIKGKTIKTDSSWFATWDKQNFPWAECSARYADPATPPGLVKLPTKEKKPVWVKTHKNTHIIADFGEETYGYLRLLDVKGKGAVRIVYAESEPEMLEESYVMTMDGWEIIDIEPVNGEYRREIPHGFRYVRVEPMDENLSVGSVTMDYEWKDVPVRGAFRCNDDELNRIWDVAIHTLELTCREVFIEGVKRDHWVWSGDAVQSFLMNYYTFGDYDGCRDTLWTLRGKDPIVVHLNTIMDYSYYWFDAVGKYRLYSGDEKFAAQVYPRMKSLMDWSISRLDENGRPVDRPGDWVFVDWAPRSLDNGGGVVSFEEMLFVRALEATAAIARDVGADADAEAYLARAAKLKAEIVPLFWDEERGALRHILKNDGTQPGEITRYANMFGLFFGYFDEEKTEKVVKNVILNDEIMKIQTPYMRFYELEALLSLGMQEEVLKEMKSYWGDMLRLGATTFWELYNPDEKGLDVYAMYGRKFGKSLCHAWGASPAYLLGKYYFGVVPTKNGFAEYEVKPVLGGMEWFDAKVPTPHGEIELHVDQEKAVVKGVPGTKGRLTYLGRTVEIDGDSTVEIKK